jgi:hypothetical protein
MNARFSLPWPGRVRPELLLLALLATSAARADEALLVDGRRVEGKLEADSSGRLQFLPAASQERLELANLHAVRLASMAPFSWRHGALHVVHLRDEQRLVGDLLTLDDKTVRLRTPLLGQIELPRSAATAVTQPTGSITVLYEDFEGDLKGWMFKGVSGPSVRKPCLGKQSLPLERVGQEAMLELPEPLDAGRIDLHFHVPDEAAGARWTCAAQFGTGAGARNLTVELAGEGGNVLESNLPGGTARTMPRSAGWRRLSIRFHPSYALVGIDDSTLWMSDKLTALGPLRSVHFACAGLPGKEQRGELFIDDLVISRTIHVLPRPAGEVKQDEVWLESGDQLFGAIVRADRRTITLKHRGEERSLAWSQARGFFFPVSVETGQAPEGERVRLWLETGCGAEADQVEGVVQKLDDKRLILKHRILGELTIDRNRVSRLRPLRTVTMH